MTDEFCNEDNAFNTLDEMEALGVEGRDGYDDEMETLLSTTSCPQCRALSDSNEIRARLRTESKKQKDRGRLIACSQIMLIPHRCGEGINGYGYRTRNGGYCKSETSV